MSQRKIIVPQLIVRPRRAQPPSFSIDIKPHHMRWEVGRYHERLRSGPGGIGRGRVWRPEAVGEQHNIVLDTIGSILLNSPWVNIVKYGAVGTGSSAPATTQQILDAEVARTSNRAPGWSDTPTKSFVSDGVYRIEKGVEFDPTMVGGQNLTEWGFSPYRETDGQLISRELFRDNNGNPITLSVNTDQYLRLIYAVQITLAPLTQAVSMDIANLGTFTGTMRLSSRAASDGISKAYDYYTFEGFVRGYNVETGGMSIAGPSTYDGRVWGGDITVKQLTLQPVTGRTRSSDAITFSPSEGNHEWKTLFLKRSGKSPGVYITLDTSFTKDDLHTLTIDPWTISW